MQIKVEELTKALGMLKPGLAKNELMEHTTYFVFDKDSIYTYNDRIAIAIPFKCDVKGAVRGTELYKLLGKIEEEEVVFKASTKEIRISCKGMKAGLNLIPKEEINWSHLPKVKSGKWLSLPKSFLKALQFCIFSCAKDATLGFLTYLQLQEDQVSSCDNFRATKYTMDGKVAEPFLLPRDAAEELLKYEIKGYQTSKGWIHFKTKDGAVFSSRAIPHEKYGDISHFFNVKGESITLPAEFGKVVERSRVITEDSFSTDRFVELSIGGGEIICRGEGNYGWIEEKQKIKYNGKKFTVKLQPEFLLEILDHSRRVVVGDTMILFRAREFSHVMCQIVEMGKK